MINEKDNRLTCGLLPDNGKLSVGIHLDDAARLMPFTALPTVLHHVVNGILDFFADFIESLRCRLSADVGAGADDRLLETETEFLAELFLRDADAGTIKILSILLQVIKIIVIYMVLKEIQLNYLI